jgi:hypothetical protein
MYECRAVQPNNREDAGTNSPFFFARGVSFVTLGEIKPVVGLNLTEVWDTPRRVTPDQLP